MCFAHSVPTPAPAPPFHLEGTGLFDANHRQFVLFGVQMQGLDAMLPTEADTRSVAAMTPLSFRVIRQRWNMNCVRLLVSPWVWQRDKQDYLDKVAQIAERANAEGLIVVLVASDSARAGAPFDTGLPGPEVAEFWSAWAAYFKDNPRIVFDLYGRPSPQAIPGYSGTHRASDWDFWRNGGTASNGRTAIGMQALADRIREAGATQQFISAPAFHDPSEFRGLTPSAYLQGTNILYEMHPYFDRALTDAQRDTNFGFLAASLPLYAGEWGTPFEEDSASCRSVPADPVKAGDAVSQLLVYLAIKNISWTAVSFAPGSLISDYDSYAATTLDHPWTCGQIGDPQPGIGGIILLFLTGDPAGFGSIAPEFVASAAGGPPGPVAPGEVVTFYGQLVGPLQDTPGVIDETGQLMTVAGETRVLFDGVPAPVFATGYYQLTVQVPFEVAGKQATTVQAFYKDVPSNKISLTVAEAAPTLFTVNGPTDILAVNQDGSGNSASSPAAVGSLVTLYATGYGQTTPGGVTGRLASDPLGRPNVAVSLKISSFDAPILYAGEAPGLVGVMQINARIPAGLSAGSRSVSAELTVGASKSQSGVRIWIR
ncbi:MAG: cellulase family glycosylhydrolase [Bryobacteraceae bacterium]